MRITDIQELIDRQDGMETACFHQRDAVQASHTKEQPDLSQDFVTNMAGTPVAQHPLKVLDAEHKGFCEDCESPTFSVRDGKTGLTKPMCRECINVIRMQSVQHRQYTHDICINCEITYDSIGLVSGSNHQTWPIEDEPPGPTSRSGLKTLIAANKISVNDVTGQVEIEE